MTQSDRNQRLSGALRCVWAALSHCREQRSEVLPVNDVRLAAACQTSRCVSLCKYPAQGSEGNDVMDDDVTRFVHSIRRVDEDSLAGAASSHSASKGGNKVSVEQ